MSESFDRRPRPVENKQSMKIFIFAILGLSFSLRSFAAGSVNVYDRVFLVVQNVDEDGQFFVERVPMIGCKTLTFGARLEQFTSAYMAPSNVGCGIKNVVNEDINGLSCSKVVTALESPDRSTYSEITLDISNCPERNSPQFISMIRTAAKSNFPQLDPKREVKMTFVK